MYGTGAVEPSGVVTTTFAVPGAVPVGTTIVMDVPSGAISTTVAVTVPTVTVEPGRKPVPLIVASPPPASGPLFGETPVAVGTRR